MATIEKEIMGKEEVTIGQLIDYTRDNHKRKDATTGYSLGAFDGTLDVISKYFDKRLDSAKTDDEKKAYLNQQHRATIGHPEAVQEIKIIIKQQVEQLKLTETQYPSIYQNLIDALFHEIWGLGVVSVWLERHRNIGKCRVNGTEVRYKKIGEKHRMHEQYRSIKDVYRLIENLMRNDESAVMNREKQYSELRLYDGTRVVITQPPLTLWPTIVFRRNTVEHFTLQEQAKLQTIDYEAAPIYRMIARCGCKSIITGEPGTGKSTILLSLFAETETDKISVLAENAPELGLKSRFPDRDITEFVGDDKTMVSIVFPRTLRQDPGQYIIGEVREVEASMYKEACANTTGLVVTTMHEKDSSNVPGTLARKEIRWVQGLNYQIALTDYANHIDFVMVMELDEDQITLRNVELSEIVFDAITLTVTSRRIMWFDGRQWYFHHHIDKRLKNRMRRKNRDSFEEGMKALEALSEKYPIPEEEKEISLTWGGG
ncbi:ATPase, T2SS/T4P/T4SS family [Paenibacillus agricola]|uniref:Flp pilus assembly complex ATPase component TadA n=1 Tax=Paenibacillus agricola TaxID=2716264 RepID=A0ABX0JD90_9BACL|nr:ATPase, T2SS/T4P/T4SS family [Paenibacillus agricola]NHN33355.1 Flp pilus assembly complex ATPase component TadA [Paenibacillus agricola]